jgi:hypothetical protein
MFNRAIARAKATRATASYTGKSVNGRVYIAVRSNLIKYKIPQAAVPLSYVS